MFSFHFKSLSLLPKPNPTRLFGGSPSSVSPPLVSPSPSPIDWSSLLVLDKKNYDVPIASKWGTLQLMAVRMKAESVESIDQVLPNPLEKAKTSQLMTPESKALLSWKQGQTPTSALLEAFETRLAGIEEGDVETATTLFVSELLTAMGLQRPSCTDLFCKVQFPLPLFFGHHKASVILDIEVQRREEKYRKSYVRVPLAFGFEHKKHNIAGPAGTYIDAQIGCQLLALAQQEYRDRKQQAEKITTYMVEVRGYNFGFWKAEFTTEMIENLIVGLQPPQQTVFAVKRRKEGYSAFSGWDFSVPEDREIIIYALQTLIDHFCKQKLI